jgi:sugar fermentation stimulation protein A
VRLPSPLIAATFVKRLNRFAALVEADGKRSGAARPGSDRGVPPERVQAHVANSGRLRELFQPGRTVYLSRQQAAHRATPYDLVLVRLPTGLVSADARLPNALVRDAFQRSLLPPFAGYTHVQPEARYGHSRLDFALSGPSAEERCLVEVKSATLVVNGQARFPDAPTERGRKHLDELARAVRKGHRAAVLFIIQRGDVISFAPNAPADPAFARALRRAVRAGVEVYAYRCRLTRRSITLVGAVPVDL